MSVQPSSEVLAVIVKCLTFLFLVAWGLLFFQPSMAYEGTWIMWARSP